MVLVEDTPRQVRKFRVEGRERIEDHLGGRSELEFFLRRGYRRINIVAAQPVDAQKPRF